MMHPDTSGPTWGSPALAALCNRGKRLTHGRRSPQAAVLAPVSSVKGADRAAQSLQGQKSSNGRTDTAAENLPPSAANGLLPPPRQHDGLANGDAGGGAGQIFTLIEVGPQASLVAAIVASAGGAPAAAFAAVVPPQLPPSSQFAPNGNWLQATSSQSDEFKVRPQSGCPQWRRRWSSGPCPPKIGRRLTKKKAPPLLRFDQGCSESFCRTHAKSWRRLS